MRVLETVLVVADLLAFLALVIPMPPALRRLRQVAPATPAAAAAAQALLEGPRWQLIPAYALAAAITAVCLLGVLAPARRPVRRPRLRRFATAATAVLGVMGLVASTALPVLLPVFSFAPPTGPYRIGTVTHHWTDRGRPDVLAADPRARRGLMVQIWYPADGAPSAPRAAYVQDDDVFVAMARLARVPDFTFGHLRHVTTNAVASAPVAAERSRYPVLVFLEGAMGFRQMNTFQIEHLVSHGYVVAAVDHPYAAASVRFPDGRRTAGLPADRLRALIDRSFELADERTGEAPALNSRVLDGGLVPYLARDVTFTLDHLAALDGADPAGVLTGRLDLRSIGAFGISLGGIVTGEACRAEPRLRACLMMDTRMTPGVVREGLDQPSMWITRDAATMRREGWSADDIDQHQSSMRAVFDKRPADGYFVRVPGMFHADFTDISSWSPVLSRFGLTGSVPAERAHAILNAYSLAFFDRHLRDLPAPLLDGPAPGCPDVLLETRRP
ncbi:alpha/beta hydrolase family protein [Streptosporangium sp. H16]|uniref:alpha/beta hydrolase family protein n=1 Tax=Streptosporangium sp. H16 TaxID=3444184 RepID=UPI003F7A1862